MLLHAYDYTTLLLMWHKHGIRSYSVRIVPDSFIGDVLPTGHRTHFLSYFSIHLYISISIFL